MCATPIVCLFVCVCVFSPPFRHTSFKYFSLFLSLSLMLASLLERFSTGIGKISKIFGGFWGVLDLLNFVASHGRLDCFSHSIRIVEFTPTW